MRLIKSIRASSDLQRTGKQTIHFKHTLAGSNVVQRTQHPIRTAPQYMRVDLRGGDVLVAHQFLHGADVLA